MLNTLIRRAVLLGLALLPVVMATSCDNGSETSAAPRTGIQGQCTFVQRGPDAPKSDNRCRPGVVIGVINASTDSQNTELFATTFTDEKGEYSMELPPGEYRLGGLREDGRIYNYGGAADNVKVVKGSVTELDITTF